MMDFFALNDKCFDDQLSSFISDYEAIAFDLQVAEVIIITQEEKVFEFPHDVASRFIPEEKPIVRVPKIPKDAWVVDYSEDALVMERNDLSYHPLVLVDPTAYPADSRPDHGCEFFKGPDGTRMHNGICWYAHPVGECSICGLLCCLRCMEHSEHENMLYQSAMLCEDGYRDGMTWPRPEYDVHVLVAMTVRPEL